MVLRSEVALLRCFYRMVLRSEVALRRLPERPALEEPPSGVDGGELRVGCRCSTLGLGLTPHQPLYVLDAGRCLVRQLARYPRLASAVGAARRASHQLDVVV